MGRLKNDPYLDESMIGFIYNTARKQFWRVALWYEFEDLIQDGYMCYYKCRDRYLPLEEQGEEEPIKLDRKWMMMLVRTTFNNHISTLAGKERSYDVAISQLGSEDRSDWLWDKLLPPEEESATLRVLISQAPTEIKELIQLLTGDGVAALGFVRSKVYKVPTNGRVRLYKKPLRETTNSYYCRLLGLDPEKCDMRKMVRMYFNGDNIDGLLTEYRSGGSSV